MLDPENEIIVASGTYTNTVVVVYSLVLGVITNSLNRPVLSLVTPAVGVYSIVTVGVNGALTITRMNFVYNVIPYNNVNIINTVDVSASVTINNCTFSVNGSSAVVPLSIINHAGGRIYVFQCIFTDFSLSTQSLFLYYGFYFFFKTSFELLICYICCGCCFYCLFFQVR